MPNNFRHEAIIDLIIACPEMNKGDIALELGYTQPYLSILMNSDAFQMRLAERRGAMSEIIAMRAAGRLEELDEKSQRIVKSELEKADCDPNYALNVQRMVTSQKIAEKKGSGGLVAHADKMQIIQNNTTISHDVLRRAQNKLRNFGKPEDEDDSLVAEVLA